MADREEIMLGLDRGESLRSIGRSLKRSLSTISREVAANGGRESYRIWPAPQRARACTRRPKVAKRDDPVLCEKVTSWLEEFWPPDEISFWMRVVELSVSVLDACLLSLVDIRSVAGLLDFSEAFHVEAASSLVSDLSPAGVDVGTHGGLGPHGVAGL